MAEGKIVTGTHEYQVPKREIFNMEDMPKWKKSEAYYEYQGFLEALNQAVKGKAINGQYPRSPAIGAMINILNDLDALVDKFPPIDQPQRFGNQAFRNWYMHLQKEVGSLLQQRIPQNLHGAIPEIQVYLVESFGNSTRIDYGTGHEMAFLWLLSCLFKVGFFHIDDKCAVGLVVFDRYLRLVRKLQTTYRMEPAGSRGVWSLDDFQFVPFIWGSAQLINHPRIEPKSFVQPEVVDANFQDYLFLACIRYINSVKTGPFFEHSNQLYNVSGVSSWSSVNQGLLRMYNEEILNKFPVVQHILFGSLMSIKPCSKSLPSGPGRGRPQGSRAPPTIVDPSKLPPPTS